MVTHSKEMPLAILGTKAGRRTQTSRATALGVSRNHLIILERGQEFPSKRLRQKMIEVYGVTAEALREAILKGYLEYVIRDISRDMTRVVLDLLKERGLLPP
jgi:transcriptional regulator with XRE-family HTH domain